MSHSEKNNWKCNRQRDRRKNLPFHFKVPNTVPVCKSAESKRGALVCTTHTRAHARTHTRMHTHMHAHAHTRTHTHTNTRTHRRTHAYAHTHMHTRTRTHTRMHKPKESNGESKTIIFTQRKMFKKYNFVQLWRFQTVTNRLQRTDGGFCKSLKSL